MLLLPVPVLLQRAPSLPQSQAPGWAAPSGVWECASRSTGAQGGCALHVLLVVLTVPQDLVISLAMKLYMGLPSTVCESQHANCLF